TLPAPVYTDPAVLAREKTRVFGASWQLVGRAEQVARPGDFFAARVADEEILVVRGEEGTLRALSNVCRHRAGPVAQGTGSRRALTCGYHGWTYGLDGRLLSTPEFEGVEDFSREDVRLPAFSVATWIGLVFSNLDPKAPALASTLEGLHGGLEGKGLGSMRLAHRRDWTLACNWKVYVDNYLEGYHIPIVHPGLMKELDYGAYRTETFQSGALQVSPIKGKGGRLRSEGPGDEAAYWWIWPNLMLNVYPDNFSTNLIVPLGEERTLTVFEWFFSDPEGPGVRARVEETVAFSDEIQLEDIAICEAVQRGLRSRTYVRGRYSKRRESGVHHFHRLWAAAMELPRTQEP
ncbi:MAG TPA: SRPBCC family protein, partial [Thermoanaerobaculia bacterium]|nr:SRPBCC family protein [Thermoanaerobaculia bacterium]